MNADQTLLHAINLIETGNKIDGRELLKQIIHEHPDNADVLFTYAQYCGKRDQAIAALEQVLKMEPAYPGAREALERIAPVPAAPVETPKSQPAFVTLEQDDPWNQSLQPDANTPPIIPNIKPTKKKRASGIPKWFIAVTASLLGCLLLGGLGIGALFLAGNMEAKADAAPPPVVIPLTAETTVPPATIQPYVTPTSTPDPCTCEAVNAYMTSHLTRVNQLLAEMDFATKKLKKKALKEQDAATLVQNATQMYTAQRAETIPACLESYQKDAVKMFWTWQQAVTAIQNGDANGALAFIQIITDDSNQLDAKMSKLLTYPTLQSCNFAFPTVAAPQSWVPGSQVLACNP